MMPGTLTHSPAQIIKKLMVDMGLGLEPPNVPWPIYYSSEPDAPDSVITVYDTQGLTGQRANPDGERSEFHGIQVRVRAANHGNGFLKGRAIAVAFDQDVYLESVTIGAATYMVQAITRTSDVLVLGKDTPTSKRSLFTLNAVCSLWEV